MWISQSEGTDTKAGVALKEVSYALEGKREGYGQMGAHPGQKAQGKVQGTGTQGVPFKLASGAWNLDNPWSIMSHCGPCALRGTSTK